MSDTPIPLSLSVNMAICHHSNARPGKASRTKAARAAVLVMAFCSLSIGVSAEPLQALVVDTPPLSVLGLDGKPLGVSVDLLALLSRELKRDIEPLILHRDEVFKRLSAEQFDLVFLYERSPYTADFALLGRVGHFPQVQVMLAGTNPASVKKLGYLAQMAPPPMIYPPHVIEPFQAFQSPDEAYSSLTQGRIQGLLLPQISARTILNEPPFNSGGAFTSQTLSSWPVGLYARKHALTAAETEAVKRTLDIVREEKMIDFFLERYYRAHAPSVQSALQPGHP